MIFHPAIQVCYLLIDGSIFFTAVKLLGQGLYLLLKTSALDFIGMAGFIHFNLLNKLETNKYFMWSKGKLQQQSGPHALMPMP